MIFYALISNLSVFICRWYRAADLFTSLSRLTGNTALNAHSINNKITAGFFVLLLSVGNNENQTKTKMKEKKGKKKLTKPNEME